MTVTGPLTRGEVVLRDGRRLSISQGAPSPGDGGVEAPWVVFEAGLAGPGDFWALAQARVARFARTVSYDRAGLGRSEADPAPRTIDRMADDLNGLIDALAIRAVVLVGHSAGGPIVRAATAARPDRVVGLVIVDGTDEGYEAFFRKWFRCADAIVQFASSALARVGLLGRLYRGQLAKLPTAVVESLAQDAFTVSAMRTRGAELRGLRSALDEWHVRSPAMPDLPVTVIAGGRSGDGMPAKARNELSVALRRRAALSPRGRFVVAERSAHMIPLTEPDLIAAEIERLVRGRSSPSTT